MRAIVLAAGVGRRLGISTAKCLLEVGDRTLLSRMLGSLAAEPKVDEVVLVVGHDGDAVRAEAERFRGRLHLSAVANPEYREGNVVSLSKALRWLEGDTIIMDADVLFHPELLSRLANAPHEDCFLLDRKSSPSGEEMMLQARGGQVHRIGRRPVGEWDVLGETVGFTRLGAAGCKRLGAIVESMVSGGERNREYEEALDRLLQERPFGYVEVGELAWTEIDFPEDIARAVEKVLPRITP